MSIIYTCDILLNKKHFTVNIFKYNLERLHGVEVICLWCFTHEQMIIYVIMLCKKNLLFNLEDDSCGCTSSLMPFYFLMIYILFNVFAGILNHFLQGHQLSLHLKTCLWVKLFHQILSLQLRRVSKKLPTRE